MAGFVALVLSYVLSQFYRSFLAVLTPILGDELGMSPGELAAASGAWFVTFALMQFPVGYLLDTRGPRLTAAVVHGLAAGGGAALFASATSGTQLIIAMGLIGIGCSPVLMAAFYLFARQYSPARFATLGSTFIAVGSLGNVVASQPMAAAAELVGWRGASWALCGVTVAVAILIWLFVRDPERVEHAAARPGDGYLTLLRLRSLWPIFPMIFLGYAVAAGIRGLWTGPYLHAMHGMSVSQIGEVTLYMAIALSLGSLIYGPLDRLFDTRKYVVLAGNAVVAAAAAWLAFAPDIPAPEAAILLVVIGLFGTSYAVQLAHGKAYIPPHLAGRGVTLMNFFSIGGVGVMQLASGFTFDRFDATGQTATAFGAIFALYAILLVVVLVIYLFSRDAKPSQG